MSFTQSLPAYLKTSEVSMLKTLFKKGQTAAEAVWNSKYYLPFLLLTEFIAVFCDAALECMYFMCSYASYS